jgi:crotonobetainyl-CoA:carnitine CoA-transferase CaiB-like acyl-CoA transferase
MALYRRERTGRGDYLDIAMHDSIVAWTANVLGDVFAHKRPPIVKHERTFGGSAFYNIYRTQDGRHIVLGAQEIKFVRNLLNELGRPELVALCERGPGPHQQPLIDFLRGVFAARSQAQWVEWFRGKDISFAPVKNLREAMDDPQVAARAMKLIDPAGHEHLGIPIKFRAEPGRVNFALPAIGEHNEELLLRAGLSREQIAALAAAGVLGTGR